MGPLLILPVFLFFCLSAEQPQRQNSQPLTVADIPLPVGLSRVSAAKFSFGEYLRNLALKTNNTVYLHNGQPKSSQTAQYAVIDMDVGTRDLQQCADAVMRLRAEFLWQQKKFTSIRFNFLSGDTCRWISYAEGWRPKFTGNKVSWHKSAAEDHTYKNFRKYLDLVFTYANTASLLRELQPVKNVHNIQLGDVFIQQGNPYGHAVIVLDVAEKQGEKFFLLAQSFMPAQDIHVLKNFNDAKSSPWYNTHFGNTLSTPEWTFTNKDLYRFSDN